MRVLLVYLDPKVFFMTVRSGQIVQRISWPLLFKVLARRASEVLSPAKPRQATVGSIASLSQLPSVSKDSPDNAKSSASTTPCSERRSGLLFWAVPVCSRGASAWVPLGGITGQGSDKQNTKA